MAFSASPADARYTYQMFNDTDVDENVKVDVTGAAATLYYLDCVSTLASSSLFVKFYDETTVTRGTSEPVFIVKIPASGTKRMSFPDGIPFTTALSYCCDDGAGKSAGNGPPAGNMTLRFVVT